MHYFFSRASHPVVRRLAEGRTLCAFDFDGTLSPIVEHPDDAGMRPVTRTLLACLGSLYPCVIVSGRARHDLLDKLGGVAVTRAIGNHGAETDGVPPATRREVERWKCSLDLELESLPGMWVEDKGLSLAVHYRQATRKTEARRRILEAARNLKNVRVLGGKQVVNLTVNRSPHKGQAVAAERDRLKCDWVLYVGDDENDEDAFRLEGNVVPVRIGRKRQSHAQYYLRTQTEIDRLLEMMIEGRRA
ncbi:MAG: trehalose-phosphatase [Candidatus Solibacter sp.]